MTRKKVTKLPEYYFSKKSKNQIFDYLKARIFQISEHKSLNLLACNDNFENMYSSIIEDVKNKYSLIALEHLYTSLKFESNRYTDQHLKKIVTFFLAIGGFLISLITMLIDKFSKYNIDIKQLYYLTIFTILLILIGSICLIISKVLTSKAKYISSITFLIEKALDEKKNNY